MFNNATGLFTSQSRAISRKDPIEVKEGIKYNSIESTIALSISFFVNMFVICVFGAVSCDSLSHTSLCNVYLGLVINCILSYLL